MSLNPNQLRELVVRPTLLGIGMYSQEAENLVMGTAAQESGLIHLKQRGGGPALGLWQMEPETFNDILLTYLASRQILMEQLLGTCHLERIDLVPDALIWNLRLGAAMCRIKYHRNSTPIPVTIPGQANYWKQFYNTSSGAGTTDEYVLHYSLVT